MKNQHTTRNDNIYFDIVKEQHMFLANGKTSLSWPNKKVYFYLFLLSLSHIIKLPCNLDT